MAEPSIAMPYDLCIEFPEGRERDIILIIRENYLRDPWNKKIKKWPEEKCSNKAVREVGTQKTETSKRERVLTREPAS